MDLLKKMNFKKQTEISVMNAPASFSENLALFRQSLTVIEDIPTERPVEFVLLFVTNREEVQKYADLVLPKVTEDALVWFAYPKKSSKKYRSDVSRDQGWETLEAYQYEGVRLIAIDEDWSAMRFKPKK